MTINRDKNYIYYQIAITHFFTLILVLSQKNISFLPTFIIWIITSLLPNFMLSFTKNLKTIEIGNKSSCLIFNKYFKETQEVYKFENLNFTYKIETGSKGSRSWEFRIYKKGREKSIIRIGGMFDGWTEDKIADIIMELENNGVIVAN
jgi:hypothetical protein